jgi:hypothetical protein
MCRVSHLPSVRCRWLFSPHPAILAALILNVGTAVSAEIAVKQVLSSRDFGWFSASGGPAVNSAGYVAANMLRIDGTGWHLRDQCREYGTNCA